MKIEGIFTISTSFNPWVPYRFKDSTFGAIRDKTSKSQSANPTRFINLICRAFVWTRTFRKSGNGMCEHSNVSNWTACRNIKLIESAVTYTHWSNFNLVKPRRSGIEDRKKRWFASGFDSNANSLIEYGCCFESGAREDIPDNDNDSRPGQSLSAAVRNESQRLLIRLTVNFVRPDGTWFKLDGFESGNVSKWSDSRLDNSWQRPGNDSAVRIGLKIIKTVAH